MLGIVEGIGHGLVNRHRDGAYSGIGLVAAMYGDSFQLLGLH
jgi:hypothetical protein